MKRGWIALGTALVLVAGACSSGNTVVAAPPATSASTSPVSEATTVPPATAAPITAAPSTTLAEPPPSTEVAVAPPDPNDIANYVAVSGSIPMLTQPADCFGAAGVCLFQPIGPVVDRLGPEDQRYGEPSADYRTWTKPGWRLTIRNDETGTITLVNGVVDGDAVVAASDDALIGSTTIGAMRDSGIFASECYSGFEGQVFFFYTYPGDDEGSAIISFGNAFRVGEPGTPERFGPLLDSVPIQIFEVSTTGTACEPSPP